MPRRPRRPMPEPEMDATSVLERAEAALELPHVACEHPACLVQRAIQLHQQRARLAPRARNRGGVLGLDALSALIPQRYRGQS